jgi:hypothetical protein
MNVYLLNFDGNTDTYDYTGVPSPRCVGHTSVHGTLAGANAKLDNILTDCGIDVQAARYEETRTATSIWNKPDPDTLDGVEVTYSIIKMEVEA